MADDDIYKGLKQSFDYTKAFQNAFKAFDSNQRKKSAINEIEKRGALITYAINIEYVINICLAVYFIDDINKIDEFIHVLLISESQTFNGKTLALAFVCDNYFNEFNKKYNSEVKSKKFNTILKNFVSSRNKFAHRPSVDYDKKDYMKQEYFVLKTKGIKEKDKKIDTYNPLVIDDKEFNEYENDYDFLLDALLDLLKMIIEKREDNERYIFREMVMQQARRRR